PHRLLTGKLLIHALSMQSIALHSAPSEEETVMPEDLSLPVELTVERLHIGALHGYTLDDEPVETRQPDFSLSGVSLRLDSHARQHAISRVALSSAFGALQATGFIETAPPFRLRAMLRHDASEKWGVTQAAVSGTLEQMNL